jgi:hypothetical protein
VCVKLIRVEEAASSSRVGGSRRLLSRSFGSWDRGRIRRTWRISSVRNWPICMPITPLYSLSSPVCLIEAKIQELVLCGVRRRKMPLFIFFLCPPASARA